MTTKHKYQFSWSRYLSGRTVTVTAIEYDEAIYRAREELDRRHEKQGREPPVGYDLECIDIREAKHQIKELLV